jgi:hypothetical protein
VQPVAPLLGLTQEAAQLGGRERTRAARRLPHAAHLACGVVTEHTGGQQVAGVGAQGGQPAVHRAWFGLLHGAQVDQGVYHVAGGEVGRPERFAVGGLHPGVRDRVFVSLASAEPPSSLWWLSVHGIYRSCDDTADAALRLLPETWQEEAVESEPLGEELLHPKYKLPTRCFAYVGQMCAAGLLSKRWRGLFLLTEPLSRSQRVSARTRRTTLFLFTSSPSLAGRFAAPTPGWRPWRCRSTPRR